MKHLPQNDTQGPFQHRPWKSSKLVRSKTHQGWWRGKLTFCCVISVPWGFRDTFYHSVVEVKWIGLSTWKALENNSVTSNCSSWRIQDFHLVWGAGTHDHGLGHHASHLGWLQVAKQDGHAVLHLHRNNNMHIYSSEEKKNLKSSCWSSALPGPEVCAWPVHWLQSWETAPPHQPAPRTDCRHPDASRLWLYIPRADPGGTRPPWLHPGSVWPVSSLLFLLLVQKKRLSASSSQNHAKAGITIWWWISDTLSGMDDTSFHCLVYSTLRWSNAHKVFNHVFKPRPLIFHSSPVFVKWRQWCNIASEKGMSGGCTLKWDRPAGSSVRKHSRCATERLRRAHVFLTAIPSAVHEPGNPLKIQIC